MNCLLFHVGGLAFGLLAEDVAEIVFLPELLRPPGMPWNLEGLLVISGEAVPAIRIDRLFSLSELELTDYTQILLVRAGARLHGWLVERTEGLLSLEFDQLVPLTSGATFHSCVAGTFLHKERTFHLLASQRVLLEQERLAAEELARSVEERLSKLDAS